SRRGASARGGGGTSGLRRVWYSAGPALVTSPRPRSCWLYNGVTTAVPAASTIRSAASDKEGRGSVTRVMGASFGRRSGKGCRLDEVPRGRRTTRNPGGSRLALPADARDPRCPSYPGGPKGRAVCLRCVLATPATAADR